MSSVYRGLLMGRSSGYYKDVLRKIIAASGNRPFTWTDIQKRHPEIGKSVLSRLKCSNFIVKVRTPKATKQSFWILHPEVGIVLNPPMMVRNKKRRYV